MLVLGGGDGLAVREILKYPSIESITLVDLDPADDRPVRQHPTAARAEPGCAAFAQGQDRQRGRLPVAGTRTGRFYDFIVVDFPDPTNYMLGKLYTNTFYRLLEKHLAEHGLVGDPGHLAVLRPRNPSGASTRRCESAASNDALPRLGAFVRRMGLHHRRPSALHATGTLRCRDCALSVPN